MVFEHAQIKNIVQVGAVGIVYNYLQPPPGLEWRLLHLNAYHNDSGAPHDLNLEIADKASGVSVYSQSLLAVASGVWKDFKDFFPSWFGDYLKLTPTYYLIVESTAIPGFSVIVEATVLEQPLEYELKKYAWEISGPDNKNKTPPGFTAMRAGRVGYLDEKNSG